MSATTEYRLAAKVAHTGDIVREYSYSKADVFNMRIIPVFLRQVFNTCDIQRRTDTGGIKLHDRAELLAHSEE